jgi:alpha-1,2-mannosyltransferase
MQWYAHVLIVLFITWRVLIANRMPITDCDEVYNYWEPLHFLLRGRGLQTWEYAHEYALRTYAYLMPLKFAAKAVERVFSWNPAIKHQVVLRLTGSSANVGDTLAVFYVLRATLAGAMAVAEVLFLRALGQRCTDLVVVWTGVVFVTAAGMNHAAGAFLPSSTWAMAYLLASAALLSSRNKLFVIIAVTATLVTGWPFGAAILLPLGVRVLFQEYMKGRLAWLVLWIVTTTAILQTSVMLMDHHFYGKWTSPTWNIFVYNAAGGGDELYGVEPLSYYLKNLTLNLNGVAPLGVPALVLSYFSQRRCIERVTILSPLWLWMAMTFPRPHKEERFLVAIYPVLCFGAVFTVDAVLNAVGRVVGSMSRHKELSQRQRGALFAFVFIPMALLSLCRTVALSRYYTAPLHIYARLSKELTVKYPYDEIMICTCGEWHRFPGSFFLPDNARIGFLPSSFKGQLPQPFSLHGSKAAGQSILGPFNDQNKEETSRYVGADDCTWVVDLVDSDCAPEGMQVVARVPFLDSARTSTLHRTLYIPWLHERAVHQGQVHYLDYAAYAWPSSEMK